MRYAVLIAVLSFAVTGAAFAATNPSLTAFEKAFVAKTSASLNAAYANTSAAKTAGFTMLFDTRRRTRAETQRVPVQAARWVKIPEHVHYAYTVDGNLKYGVTHATTALRAGTITAAELRANGARLPKGADPKGAFADKNPSVK